MKNRGFTLIEILVSVAIFATVMVIALGALLALSEANRRAQAINSAVNNLSAAFDSMSRTIRTGQTYACVGGSGGTSPDCTATPGYGFTFTAFGGDTVTYCLSNGAAASCGSATTCAVGSRCSILRQINSGNYLPMTSPEIAITQLSFYLIGSPITGNSVQPKVTILASGVVSSSGTASTTFNLETSVTQRLYDQ